jgi:gas vesicle protein
MITIENLQDTLSSISSDVEKFNNGNKSAGTRIRKAMQQLKGQAQDLRKEVQEIKNNK